MARQDLCWLVQFDFDLHDSIVHSTVVINPISVQVEAATWDDDTRFCRDETSSLGVSGLTHEVKTRSCELRVLGFDMVV